MGNQVRSREEMLVFKSSLLRTIEAQPDISSSEILKQNADQTPATVLWHLRVMAEKGIITREKDEENVYHYRLKRGAFRKLRAEYGHPVKRRTLGQGLEVVLDAADSPKKELNGVSVSSPTIKMTINGDTKEVPLETAKSLYFELKRVFDE